MEDVETDKILVIQGKSSKIKNIIAVCIEFNLTKEKLKDLIDTGKAYNGCYFDYSLS